jgi:hypothetical protein
LGNNVRKIHGLSLVQDHLSLSEVERRSICSLGKRSIILISDIADSLSIAVGEEGGSEFGGESEVELSCKIEHGTTDLSGHVEIFSMFTCKAG